MADSFANHTFLYVVFAMALEIENEVEVYLGEDYSVVYCAIRGGSLFLWGFQHVLKKASRLYVASWVRDIGPDLLPNDYKKDERSEDKSNGAKSTPKEKEPSTLEDLVVAARGGMETLRTALQRVYMTRASAYRDALKSFIEGYQEGIQQATEKEEDSKAQQEVNALLVELGQHDITGMIYYFWEFGCTVMCYKGMHPGK
ncbi:hypothetical protein SLEP1_g40524 [Rubroshorea leprosula]|uniref:Uncharacterized protein n=1 Tax=Rubroshorea leprosula TaxID=152421 RepID=A0AAV5L415_9ROSI|nr:hypothetical protein SLEP1_g40524 [Rubroshorea leprosula]